MATKRLEIGTIVGTKHALTLPATETTTQTIVVYGGRGMGKTNFGAVVCEELAAAGRRFCFVDPMGVAWGLRHSADGQGQGIKILILGGRHGDLPIEPRGGAVVANFVATTNANILIDISAAADGRRWSQGQKVRFMADYLERLLEVQGEHRRPLMQIIDEAARFAPQTIEFKRDADDPVARCKAALEVLVEEGRNGGVGVMLLTQRSARMAKSVSELAELMVAFRIVGPNSTQAVLDWFGAHVDKARHHELLEQLRKLPRGTALIVSPGWLDFEGVAAIRLRQTFDSSKTPTGTEQKLAKRARPANLEKLREEIAATVEKAEAADPSKLQARLQAVAGERDRLREQLVRKEATLAEVDARTKQIDAKLQAKADQAATRTAHTELKTALVQHRRALEAAMKILVKVKTIDFAIETDDDRKALEQAIAAAVRAVTQPIEKRVTALVSRVEGFKLAAKHAEDQITALLEEKIDLTVQVAKREPYAITPPAAPKVRSQAPKAEPIRRVPDGPLSDDRRLTAAAGDLKKHVRAILTALAQHPDGRTREQVLILAGYSPSGDISTAFAGLLEHGLVASNGAGPLRITDAGLELLGDFDPLPAGAELRAELVNGSRLGSAERKLLGALFDAYPEARTRAELHEAAALKPSGDTSTAISKFRRLGWVETRDGGLVAAATFFPEVV